LQRLVKANIVKAGLTSLQSANPLFFDNQVIGKFLFCVLQKNTKSKSEESGTRMRKNRQGILSRMCQK
jgi:hypothetical protein